MIDTNVLLVSISDRSDFHWLYQDIIDGVFSVAVTTEITDEYAEIIGRRWHPDVADDVLRTLLELPNVQWTEVFFRMNLITDDPDDDKFADCAFAANADHVISNDRHFDKLREYDFPQISVLTIEALGTLLGK